MDRLEWRVEAIARLSGRRNFSCMPLCIRVDWGGQAHLGPTPDLGVLLLLDALTEFLGAIWGDDHPLVLTSCEQDPRVDSPLHSLPQTGERL